MKQWMKIFCSCLVCAPLCGADGTSGPGSQTPSTAAPAVSQPAAPSAAPAPMPPTSNANAVQSAVPVAPADTLAWVTDYRAGMDAAQKAHKPVFLYFTGSDWCGWCKKLDQEVLSQPDFAKSMGSKFVFIKLDFPMNRDTNDPQMQQNAQLKQQYGVTGFPTVVLLDASGQFVAEAGYRSGGARAYASFIEQLMSAPQS